MTSSTRPTKRGFTATTQRLFALGCSMIAVLIIMTGPRLIVNQASSQEFFPKNYVQQESARPTPEQASPKVGTENKQLASVMPLTDRTQALVYVNSSNKEHFDRVVAKVLAIQKQRKIQIQAVIHIGDYRTISPNQRESLVKAGIFIVPATQLPEKLPVTQSPAWGIMTPESREQGKAYVIEGYHDPEIFFNSLGRFEIPAGMQVGKDTETAGKLAEF